METPMCGECVKYIPDLVCCVAGYCLPKKKYTYYYGDVCEDFVARTKENLKRILNEKGVLYCFDCKEAILSADKLDLHNDHIVAGDVFVTEDMIKELCCAD